MRRFNHTLTKSKSGKSATLRIQVDDQFGNQTMNFSSIQGWRGILALKHLSFESKEWNDDVARKFVGIEVLRCAKNEYEGIKFLESVKNLAGMEVHFWASKFLMKEKAGRAWRALYS